MSTAIIVYSIILNAIYSDIDPNLALAVAQVESRFNPNAVGGLGEQGLFQIMPEYSGYTKEQLKDPVINIREGMRMLKYAKKHCRHKEDKTWIVCYNAGVGGGSKLNHPKKFKYYVEVMKVKKQFKSQAVAGK